MRLSCERIDVGITERDRECGIRALHPAVTVDARGDREGIDQGSSAGLMP